MSRSVLVIEDDRDIAQLVKIHVEELHCRVKLVHDGTVGLAEAESGSYDLIILDLMLPGIDGLEITRRLRARTNYTPLLMLTAKSSELERVLGLEMGADDYLTKEFNPRELVARVKAVLRRAVAPEPGTRPTREPVEIGNTRIDPDRREVTIDGRQIELRFKEFDLLLGFVQHLGLVLERDRLLNIVWGYDYFGDTRTVDVHVAHLRDRIAGSGLPCARATTGRTSFWTSRFSSSRGASASFLHGRWTSRTGGFFIRPLSRSS